MNEGSSRTNFCKRPRPRLRHPESDTFAYLSNILPWQKIFLFILFHLLPHLLFFFSRFGTAFLRSCLFGSRLFLYLFFLRGGGCFGLSFFGIFFLRLSLFTIRFFLDLSSIIFRELFVFDLNLCFPH